MTEVVDCDFSVEGSGPPLFLIHGIGAARDAWRFLRHRLESKFSVVSYDLRGHGASPASPTPFGLDELVNDLERVRELSGFDTAYFAGHSLGGMIAPAYARRHPKRVQGLGLLSTAAGRSVDDAKKVQGVVRAMEVQGIEPVLATLSNRWFRDEFIGANPEIVSRRMRQVIETDPEIFLNVFRIYAETEMLPWLPAVDAPTLVPTGENDGGCSPRLNQKIAAALPNGELVVLPSLRHAILLEAPDLVAENLVRFFR